MREVGRRIEASAKWRVAWVRSDAEASLESTIAAALPALDELGAEVPATSLMQRIERAATTTGLIVVVDDVHHLTEEQARFLAKIVRRCDPIERVALVLAARTPEFRKSAFAALVPTVPTLVPRVLEALDRPSSYALVRSVADVSTIDPTLADGVLRLCKGRPLFLEIVTRHLLDIGAARIAGSKLDRTDNWDRVSLPERLEGLLRVNITTASQEERAVLNMAAVAGETFSGTRVAKASGQPPLRTLELLQEIQRRCEVVVATPTGWRFSHPAFREVLLANLAPELERTCHAALAATYSTTADIGADQQDRLARHLASAGDLRRARPLLTRAAQRAARRQETERALELLKLAGALDGKTSVTIDQDNRSTLLDVAIGLSDTRRLELSKLIIDSLRRQAAAESDDLWFAAVDSRVARMQACQRGTTELSPARLEECARLLGKGRSRGDALFALGVLARFSGDHVESARLLERSRSDYATSGELGDVSSALDQLGSVHRLAGNLDSSLRLFREASDLSRRAGRELNAAISDVNTALLEFESGAGWCVSSLRTAISQLEAEGASPRAAHACVILAHMIYSEGDVASALSTANAAAQRLQSSEYHEANANAWSLCAELEAIRGNGPAADSALRHVKFAQSSLTSTDDSRETLALTALCAAAQERYDVASVAGARVIERWDNDMLISEQREVATQLALAVFLGADVRGFEEIGNKCADVGASRLVSTVDFCVELPTFNSTQTMKSASPWRRKLLTAFSQLAASRRAQSTSNSSTADRWRSRAVTTFRDMGATALAARADSWGLSRNS